MYVREKKHRSGRTSVVIVDKASGKYREVHTVGISSDVAELEALVSEGKAWIERHRRETELFLDLFGEEREAMRVETEEANRVLSNISNVLLNGSELILGRVFDRIGFGRIDDPVFRSLVLSRLSFPSSKAATVEYLKNYFDEDVSLSKIYRYLDKLSDGEHTKVEDMSVEHTRKVLGGSIGVIFYDVTTLYFEADREDELRRTGFSKEGRHRNPQIILGLLVSLEGYPLAYCIHPGNEYEGHTMLPVVRKFVDKYNLEDFIVVADSGLMNEANVAQLEGLGYKYIIGERIRNKGERVTRIAMSCPRCDGAAVDVDMGGGRRLLVSYSEARARKDAYNREKGVRRLEKSYSTGRLTKDSVNKRGYNKFLEMGGKVSVSINYDKVRSDAEWDGLKGYLTNTDIPQGDVFMAYGNLWQVERAFRIAKSRIEIRPMFHFTRRRIEAHVCICFVALKVYKELERLLRVAGIGLSVDKVLSLAKTVATLQVRLPLNGTTMTRTMIMKRHKPIEKLFDEGFWAELDRE